MWWHLQAQLDRLHLQLQPLGRESTPRELQQLQTGQSTVWNLGPKLVLSCPAFTGGGIQWAPHLWHQKLQFLLLLFFCEDG